MRAVKWTVIGLGVVVGLLAATVFVITSVVDPNRYRGRVERVVTDWVGRPFVIDGKMEVTWYPWLGLRLERAHLADRVDSGDRADTGGRAGLPSAPMIEWESASVAVNVLPLLRGEFVVDRIRLQSLHVRLRRDAGGRGNWEDLGPSTRSRRATGAIGVTGAPEAAVAPGMAAAPSTAATPSASVASGTTAAPNVVQIAGLEVREGVIDYVDEASGLRINLSKLDLEMGEWRAGQSLPVHARFLIRGESLPPKGVWAQMDTPALRVGIEPLSVTTPKMAISIADGVIDGALAYEQTSEGLVSAHGSIAAHAPSLRKLAAELGLNQTMPRDPGTLGYIELRSSWSYTDGVLSAKPLALKLDGVNFEGWVEHGPAPRAGWRFELHGDRINLDRYSSVDTSSRKPFELAMLKDIDANGSLIFDEALLANARLSGVRLRVETEKKP